MWQPIETAPHDNARPLYLARFRDGKLVELDFDGSWEYWQESWELAHINGYAWHSASGIEEPSHWAYQDDAIPLAVVPELTEAELDKLLSEAYAEGRADQLEESKEKTW